MKKILYSPILSKCPAQVRNLLYTFLLFLLFTGTANAQTYTNFQVYHGGSSSGPGCAICGGNEFYIANVAINGPTPLNYTGYGVGSVPDNNHSQLDLTTNATYNTSTVTAGLASTFTVTRNIDYSWGSFLQVYIDWNNDGTFATSGTEFIGTSSDIPAGSGTPFSINYTIPSGTTPGSYRMRVVSLWDNQNPGNDPLIPNGGNSLSIQGEAIDFQITVLSGCTGPTTAAAWASPGNTTSSQTDISFTRGNGDGGVIVLAHDNAVVNAVPASGTTYTAGTDFTGSSVPFADAAGGQSQVGTGNWVIYTATGSNPGGLVTTTVTGLTFNHTYYFSIFEYNAASTCYTLTGTTGSVLITSPCTGTPTAGAASAITTTMCPGGSTSMSLTGYTINVSGIVFQWQSSPDGSTWTNISGAISTSYTTPSLTNATGSNKIYYYQCLVTCQSSTLSAPSNTIIITVYPTPAILVNGFNTYTSHICSAGSPNSISLTAGNSSSGTTTYSWSPSSGLNTTSGATVSAAPSTTTTYTVNGTSNNCGSIATALVTVNPSLLSFNPAAPSISSGGGVSITASASSTNVGTITYAWQPHDGSLSAYTGATVSAHPIANETYTVTATDGSGCSRTGTVTVVIKGGTAGQVSCGYAFSTGTGYASVTATSLGATGNADYLVDLSVLSTPFYIDYNGITYDQFGVNGNGWMWFNTGVFVATNLTTPLSSTSSADGFICAWGGPITGSTVGYLVQGTTPNRTLTIQWGATALAATTSSSPFSCQIILYEHNPGGANSDKIQLCYAGQTAKSMSGGYQIGLRGTSNADYNNRTQSTGSMTSTSTTAGSSNASVVTFSSTSYYISGNITWTFTPTVPTPTITPSGQQNVCTSGSGIVLTANTTVSTPTYQWINFSTGSAISGATNSMYTANPSTIGNYFYAVVVSNSAGCSRTSSSVAVVAEVCCAGIASATPAASSVCPGATTSITATGITGPNYVLTWWTGPGGTGTQLGTTNENPLTGVGAGTYYAHVTADCGSGVDASATIGSLVNVGIASATAAASPICPSAVTTLTANSISGTSASLAWYTGPSGGGSYLGNSNPLAGVAGPGTYYAHVTGTCGSVDASVTVAAKTNVGITSVTPASNSVCSGNTTSITANGVTGTNAVLTWYSGSGGTGTNYGTSNPLTGIGAGTYYARVTGDCGTAVQASTTITSGSCNITFSVKLFLQGYYLGGNTMSPLLYLLGISGNSTDVDTVTIELFDTIAPYNFHDSFKGILQTNGNVTGILTGTVSGGSYYLSVKHRNSINTWSANPVTVVANGSYDFTSAGQAYGAVANLGGGVYGIYSGDINQDGAINVSDRSPMQGMCSTFKIGVYNVNDITGDGIVDENDFRILQNNILLGISVLHH